MPRKDIPQDSLQSLKCAKALFSLCIVMVIASWLLNRSISENRSQRQAVRARYERAEQMLAKFKALQSKNASFFEDLTWCAISPWESYINIYHSLDDGDGGSYQLRNAPNELSDYSFHVAIRQFASNAAAIVAVSAVPNQRFEQLKTAVTNSFCTTNLQKLADAYVFSSDKFSRGLNTNALWRMGRIDQREEWLGLADWLAFSKWPPRGGISGYNDGSGTISYTDRFPGKWSSYDEEWHDYHQLLAGGPSQAEAILLAEWTKAREIAMSTSSPSSQVHVPGTELSLNVADLLMLSGPILVFCQSLFLIFRRREACEIAALPATDRPFIFPQFSSPDDPLRTPIPASFAEFAERVIWLCFLVLPSFVLGFGVLTRFDIVTAGETYRNLPWLQSLLIARRADDASNLLDFANLACLGISFWLLLEIACPHVQSNASGKHISVRPLFPARFVLVPLAILFVLIFFLKWDRGFLWKDIWPQAAIMVTFLLLLSWCFAVALRRRSVTGALLAAVCLLVVLRLAG